jgi:uncharacterized membrane protein
MNIYKSCSDLKNEARETLSGKYGTYALMLFIIWTATFCIQRVISGFSTVTNVMLISSGDVNSSVILTVGIVQLLILSCVTILIGTFRPGLAYFALNACCGQRTSVSDLFYGQRGKFKISLQLSAAVLGSQILCLLPCNVLVIMYNSFKTDKYAYLLAACAAFAVGICIYIPIEIMLSMSFYIMLDFPAYSASEILRTSIKVTKGHRGKLFYIGLSFIPVLLLSILSFGIGLIWVIPYMNMTYAKFYLDLMNPNHQ